MNFQYNFRLGPEAVWLVVNTVIGSVLVELVAGLMNVNSPTDIGDLSTWGWGLLFGAVRTGLGALLAVATGGGFQKPGEPGPEPVHTGPADDPEE
jgi:hypothetical protein